MKKHVSRILKASLIVVVLIINACDKDAAVSNTPVQTTYPVVSGYTATDLTGNLLGLVDSTDWRTDDVWSSSVQDLFGGSTNFNCIFEDTLMNVSAFPNPTDNYFTVAIGPIDFLTGAYVDTSTTFEFMMVNQRHEVVLSKREVTNQQMISLSLSDSLSTDTIFRIYYKFTDKNNCVRCGHGDVLRN